MSIYEVEAPLGDEWKVKTDKTQGMIVFNKGSTETGFADLIYLDHRIRAQLWGNRP